MFRHSLRVLKIYSIRNLNYKFSVFKVNNGTQPYILYLLHIIIFIINKL